jgi:hypothetical protein
MVGSQWLAPDQLFTVNHQKVGVTHAGGREFNGFMVDT